MSDPADAWLVEERALGDPQVAEVWDRLQEQGAVRSPFLDRTWCSTLETAGGEGGLAVLLGLVDGEPRALLPLQRRRAAGVRTVGAPGMGWVQPDHLDVVAAEPEGGPAAAAMVRFLARARDWDLLDLDGLSADGSLAAAVDHGRALGGVRAPERAVVAPYVDLQGRTVAELFPNRNLREQVRRGLRRAERSGGGFEVVTDPERVEPLVHELMRLHNARFGARSVVFATAQRRAFHVAAVRRLAALGRARIYRLVADGVDAALLYALVHGETVCYYSMGIEPGAGMSPGRTVLGQAIASAAAEGLAEFDLLRGDHEFKLRFASGVRTDRRVLVAGRTPRGLLGAATVAARAAAARRASRHGGPRSAP